MNDQRDPRGDPGSVVTRSLEVSRERWVELQDVLAGTRGAPFVMDDEGTSGEGTNELSQPPEVPATGRP